LLTFTVKHGTDPPNPRTPTVWHRWKFPSALIGPSQISPPPHGVQPDWHPALAGAAKAIPPAARVPTARAMNVFISFPILRHRFPETGT
jgi:hypothetical protein